MLTMRLDASDAGVSTALGWPDRVVPGADVTIERSGDPSSRQTAQTDSAGQVRFESLLAGVYHAGASRVLTGDEKARLGASDVDVGALAAGGDIDVAAPSTERDLAAYAGRRGSLLISELFSGLENNTNPYWWASYLELYNNSDTIIYLDGKLVGSWSMVWSEAPPARYRCADQTRYAEDSLGLWVIFAYMFPGSGTEHPLGPGRTVLIATDAIDHTVAAPNYDDLSGADFEFIGDAGLDPDNPSVPNMITLSTTRPAGGHGLRFGYLAAPYVADHVGLDTLPNERPFFDLNQWRIPRTAVLDFAMFSYGPGWTPLPLCPQPVHPVFERDIALLMPPFGDLRSVQRRIASGSILQRTRSSARDFEVKPRSPGGVP
jgi:hypothetical protein